MIKQSNIQAVNKKIKNSFIKNLNHKLIAFNPEFCLNIEYNKRVKFVPLSFFLSDFCEHYQTDPVFIKAAATNDLESWEQLGIPPIYFYSISERLRKIGHFESDEKIGLNIDPKKRDSWFHIMGAGQTRLNSARIAQKQAKEEIYVPVVNYSRQVEFKGTPDFFNPLGIAHNSIKAKPWNASGRPLVRVPSSILYDEDAFWF
jgi:hypothetical protein